jgi:hypothetical protein
MVTKLELLLKKVLKELFELLYTANETVDTSRPGVEPPDGPGDPVVTDPIVPLIHWAFAMPGIARAAKATITARRINDLIESP